MALRFCSVLYSKVKSTERSQLSPVVHTPGRSPEFLFTTGSSHPVAQKEHRQRLQTPSLSTSVGKCKANSYQCGDLRLPLCLSSVPLLHRGFLEGGFDFLLLAQLRVVFFIAESVVIWLDVLEHILSAHIYHHESTFTILGIPNPEDHTIIHLPGSLLRRAFFFLEQFAHAWKRNRARQVAVLKQL